MHCLQVWLLPLEHCFFAEKNYLKQSKLNQQETAELKKQRQNMKKNSDTK